MMMSMKDTVMVYDKKSATCLFYPDDKFKVIFWDFAISICLLISCVFIPFNMAFQNEVSELEWFEAVLWIVDCFFIIDIFINFNTVAVVVVSGSGTGTGTTTRVLTGRKEIAAEYLRSWFIIDLLSVIPFDLFFQMSFEGAEGVEGEAGIH